MNDSGKYKWVKIADSVQELQLGDGNLVQVDADGKKVCVGLHKDQLYACTHKCPHASGPMADGYIDVLGNIVCPLHRYKFSLQNGRNTSGEGYFLKTFPVEMRDNGIFVGIPANSLFNFLK